jgi:hypothetical protein
MDEMCRFEKTVRESNRQGRDAWERFGPHRDRVHALLDPLAAPSSTLCILGAGNANDVDLGRLLDGFAEVHLVDLDVDAVHAALGRQGLRAHSRCQVHGPIDLTGVLDLLPTAAVDDPGVLSDAIVDAAAARRYVVPGSPFDVTLSAAALTQLLQSVVDCGLPPAKKVAVGIAVRDKHLDDLVTLTREGGTLVLVSDVVSTSTAPSLAATEVPALE